MPEYNLHAVKRASLPRQYNLIALKRPTPAPPEILYMWVKTTFFTSNSHGGEQSQAAVITATLFFFRCFCVRDIFEVAACLLDFMMLAVNTPLV